METPIRRNIIARKLEEGQKLGMSLVPKRSRIIIVSIR